MAVTKAHDPGKLFSPTARPSGCWRLLRLRDGGGCSGFATQVNEQAESKTGRAEGVMLYKRN